MCAPSNCSVSHAPVWHPFSGVSRGKSRTPPKRQNASKFFNSSTFLPPLHTSTTHLHCLHFLLKPSTIDMGRNRVSDDLDHVADAPTTTKKSKTAPPKPKPLPPFTPMKIHDLVHGRGKLSIKPLHHTEYSVCSLMILYYKESPKTPTNMRRNTLRRRISPLRANGILSRKKSFEHT